MADQNPTQPGNEPEPPRPESSGKGPAPVKKLPTPRIAYPKQLDLLRAYAAASSQGTTATDNNAVSEIVKMSAGTVSLANPFFSDVGLLERGPDGGYKPVRAVVDFARVHQWDPTKAGAELSKVLRDSWFAKALLPRLQYDAMPEDEAVRILGVEAEAGPAYKGQVRSLLDYLESAGLITRDGGLVRRTDANAGAPPGAVEDRPKPQAAPVEHVQPRAAQAGLPLLVQGLLEQLPSGEAWTSAEMETWLTLARNVFQVVYKIPPGETKAAS